MLRVICFLLLFFTALGLYAQTVKSFPTVTKAEEAGLSGARLSHIDKLLEEQVRNQYIPGAVALIVRNGKIAYFKAFGFSDLEKRTQLKKDDIIPECIWIRDHRAKICLLPTTSSRPDW